MNLFAVCFLNVKTAAVAAVVGTATVVVVIVAVAVTLVLNCAALGIACPRFEIRVLAFTLVAFSSQVSKERTPWHRVEAFAFLCHELKKLETPQMLT